MRLIRAADYAVRVLVYLAKQTPAARVTRDEIITNTGIPAAFLKRIIQTLVQSGLVEAHRGVRGGCSLALPADQIPVLRVIESIDGPLEFSGCLGSPEVCPRSGSCAFRRLLGQVENNAKQVLRETTIADLAADPAPGPCFPQMVIDCKP